ncbi:MAG TPA: carboxypeptidase-like regulatory domain-containing protein [Terriglobia bacterium]|nr:carboxypeptidase-like regulatory domain-containing protein [Terriglobia bacterium]
MDRMMKFKGLRKPPSLARLGGGLVLGGLLVSFVLLIGTPSVYGQATINASLSGTVADSSGAVIPDATVTLSDPGKGFSRTFTTQPDGRYLFTLVPASTYTLRVEKAGFKVYVQEGIILTVGQAATQDVTMDIGAVTQQVEVTAAAPLVNTTNATIGSEVSARETVELPLNWRNVFGLTALNSAVNPLPNTVAGAGGDITDQNITWAIMFNGGRTRSTSYLLDGHWNNTGDWGGLIYAPGVDETQEFKIVTNAFTAQYGWTMGNVLNAITKGGTQSFHGSVFEFLRNDNLDANQFFSNATGLPKPEFKRNNFGVSAGGPLYLPRIYEQKDKTFIFGYYEGIRQSSPWTSQVTVPTAAMKGGDFSALLGNVSGADALGRPVYTGAIYNPFSSRQVTAGAVDPATGLVATSSGYIRDAFGATAANGWRPTNVIPGTLFDSVAKNLLQYWPDPNAAGLTNNYVSNGSVPGWVDKYSIRVDHNISDKSRLFGRWSWNRIYAQQTPDIFGQNNVGGPGSGNINPRWDIGASYTHTFSPTFLVSVTGGWNRWFESFSPTHWGFKASSLGLPSYLDQIPGFPYVTVADVYGLGAGYLSATPREPRSLLVDVTKIHGSHNFSMGFQEIWIQNYEQFLDPAGFSFDRGMTNGPDPTSPVSSTGYGFASFLMGTGAGAGTPGQFTAAGAGGQFSLSANTAMMKKYRGFYFQDDWKVSRNLTVNLGLRWDMQTAPTERFDRIWVFDFNDAGPLAGVVPSSFTGPDGNTYPLNLNGFLTPVRQGRFGRSIYKADYRNWAPRVGLAYRLTDKLVMRSGFGIFFNETQEVSQYEGMSNYGFSTLTPWVATVGGITPYNLLSDPFPNGFIQPVGFEGGKLTQIGNDINVFPPTPTRPTPYVNQWTLGFQYQFAASDVLDVTYIGNHGTKLPFGGMYGNQLTPDKLAFGSQLSQEVGNPFYTFFRDNNIISGCGLDQPTVPFSQLLRPYPQYCHVGWRYMPGATSNFHALEINYSHRFSQGLHLNASFTWSKYSDTYSGPGYGYSPSRDNYKNDYSLNFNDIPRSFVLSYIYELPVGRGKWLGRNLNGLANSIVGGWQIAGITMFKDGFPLGMTALNNLNAYNGGQRPNCVGDPTLASHPSLPNHNILWFNTAAFAQPDAYTFGNCARTLGNIRAAGRNNWDLNISKEWMWQEKMRIQFRGEMFNAFNHTYLFAPDQSLTSATFGQVSAAGPARVVQLGLKVYW